MKKAEFITQLLQELKKHISESEASEAVFFYREMIDDALDLGKAEEDIIAGLPSIADIVKTVCDGLKGDTVAPNEGEVPRTVQAILAEETTKQQKKSKKITEQHYAPKPEQRGANIGAVVGRIIAGFFFFTIALPIIIALFASFISVVVSLWAAVLSLVVAGIAVPIYAVVVGVMGESAMVMMSYCAAGLVVLAIGLFGTKLMTVCSKGFGKIVKLFAKGIGRATMKIVRPA